ncbi:hypothetical protein F5J12DRAFT_787208 [Pisolithus orientalis]|uniref:uncharacterized protein n=1 Tax=Pisolithus orientalis TaxID=936130 RepID=UPI002224BB14|nr:uncharacterized protein F5J12DRAFT_787208 [Pisolithus orientalis]KAI5986697.1 hypothetical protein F5J12DRAFT_787208 [Pisolithus orientalis]
MVVSWQAHGFIHGVINTGKLASFHVIACCGYLIPHRVCPHHICDHSDQEGQYTYNRLSFHGIFKKKTGILLMGTREPKRLDTGNATEGWPAWLDVYAARIE